MRDVSELDMDEVTDILRTMRARERRLAVALGWLIVVLVLTTVFSVAFWPAGSGTADDRLIEMVKWTIGFVLTVVLSLGVFGWFQYRTSAEQDRADLLEYRRELSRQGRSEVQHVRRETADLRVAAVELQGVIVGFALVSQASELQSSPGSGRGVRFLKLVGGFSCGLIPRLGEPSVVTYLEATEGQALAFAPEPWGIGGDPPRSFIDAMGNWTLSEDEISSLHDLLDEMDSRRLKSNGLRSMIQLASQLSRSTRSDGIVDTNSRDDAV